MTNSTQDPATLLGRRTSLPPDLRALLERYPRANWPRHTNLGEMSRFWLQRHDMFREIGSVLAGGISELQEGQKSSPDFAAWFAPRLQFFLQQLTTHHHIEDNHYFPVFLRAEKQLERGFELLESDHRIIHDCLDKTAASANEMFGALASGGDRERRAVNSYAEMNQQLLGLLIRHLEDEEDLIIPIVLDRGEDQLGIG